MNWLKKLSDANVAKGGAAVEMRTFPTATNVVSALLAGQVDNALLVDSVGARSRGSWPRQGSPERARHGARRVRLSQQDGD